MSIVAMWCIATAWVWLSIGFALFVCPRLFRYAPGGNQ